MIFFRSVAGSRTPHWEQGWGKLEKTRNSRVFRLNSKPSAGI